MKQRVIIPRITCIPSHLFEIGKLYICQKEHGRKMTSDDFWYHALAWVADDKETFDGIGLLPINCIRAVKGDVLFPNVQFDNNTTFLEVPKDKYKPIAVRSCRGRRVRYIKSF